MEVKPGYKLTEVGVIPEDWEVSKIGMVADLLTGFPFPSIGYANSGVRLLRGSNVKRGIIDWSDDLTKYWCGATQSLEKYELREHDVVIAMDGALVGKSYAQISNYDIPSFLLQRVARLRSTDVSVDIILCWISSSIFESYVDSVKTHTAIPHISPKDILTFTIAYPRDIHEQTAIATTLSDVDALISSLDALISKKKQIKQGAMQKLLSGKRRLPGFSGEWEVKRLGEVGQCFRGVSYNPSNDLLPHDHKNSIRLLRSNNIQNSFVNILDIQFVKSYRVSSTQIMSRNDILICMANGSKDLVGKVGLINQLYSHSYTFGAFMGCLRSNIKNDPIYIFNLMQSDIFRRHISIILAGSSINNLKPSDIEFFEFSIPPLPEQKAIAAILSDMDAEITTLESRRNKTKLLKQGMMQELLTGRIRLPMEHSTVSVRTKPTVGMFQ